MALFPIFFCFSAAAYFVLGFWVVVRQKEKVQQLYGLLCITTCCWQAIWAVLLTNPNMRWIDGVMKICFTGVVFIPSTFCHFISEFTEEERYKGWLKGSYAVSTGLVGTV